MKVTHILKSVLAAALGFAAVTTASAQGKLVIKGSDTLGAKLIPQMAEAYKAAGNGVSFDIAAEGSSTGIAALISGTADIGMSSRAVTPKEVSDGISQGVTLSGVKINWDLIAIVGNASNPVANLTKAQVAGIFSGAITDWSAVGGKPGAIAVYTRNTASGTYADFRKMAMGGRDYASSAQKMAGHEQIAAEVGRNPNGIGYLGLAYLNAKGIKTITVDGHAPNAADVKDKSYPYCRQTYLYTNGAAKGQAKAFIDFVLSPAGDKVTRQVGFVPLSEVP